MFDFDFRHELRLVTFRVTFLHPYYVCKELTGYKFHLFTIRLIFLSKFLCCFSDVTLFSFQSSAVSLWLFVYRSRRQLVYNTTTPLGSQPPIFNFFKNYETAVG